MSGPGASSTIVTVAMPVKTPANKSKISHPISSAANPTAAKNARALNADSASRGGEARLFFRRQGRFGSGKCTATGFGLVGGIAFAIGGSERRGGQWMWMGGSRATAAVRTGDDLQQMAVRVVEIASSPVVPGIDFAAFAAQRVGPICEASFANTPEYLVELGLADQEGVVLRVISLSVSK
ncbi:MAG TPA: hypothetical protein VFL97_08770 [Nitrococcus sp.]|nr:hypothetical protein [Nitrococcus sp.]